LKLTASTPATSRKPIPETAGRAPVAPPASTAWAGTEVAPKPEVQVTGSAGSVTPTEDAPGSLPS
jgi:hypothetical protein